MRKFKHTLLKTCLISLLSITNAVAQEMSTNGGAPIGDNQNSKTIGQNGAVLLEDIHLIEKLAAFDRERIPERVVHARGAGAFGEFVTAGDFSAFTKAKIFAQKGKKTPMYTRFSTVIGSKGSPETVRDPRGFALRFYTEEGNYDIVGNHTPVFFIRDAMKFPDMVHSLKPSPIYNKQDPNRYFDFFSNMPESTHMLTILYTDFGIPANYRQMPGSSVHAFKWINEKGEIFYVKYSWESKQGQKFLSPEEATNVQAKDFQHATVDLYQNIENKNYPSWDMYVQIIKFNEVDNFDFNPLDPTKIWPEKLVPKRMLGTFTLNKVPDNFFEQVEQVALAPGNLIPGIEASEDKLLQGRLFSYFDTQRHRIGPNFQQLPVNQPIVAVKNYNSGGAMSNRHQKGNVNYQPSNEGNALKDNATYKAVNTPYLASKTMQSLLSKPNNYGQAGEYYRNLKREEQQRLEKNLADDLMQVKNKTVVIKMIGHFYMADRNFGMNLAKALGISREEAEKILMSKG